MGTIAAASQEGDVGGCAENAGYTQSGKRRHPCPDPGTKNKNMIPVEDDYDENTSVPYLMWNKNKAILVAGNSAEDKDITMVLTVPLKKQA